MQIVLQEQPDHRMRRHQIDLEAAHAAGICLALERGEIAHKTLRRCRHRTGCRSARPLRSYPGLQAVAIARRAGGVHAEQLVGFLQRRVIGEDRLQPGDPVGALAGFAVGNALEARSQHPLTVVKTSRASRSGTLPTR